MRKFILMLTNTRKDLKERGDALELRVTELEGELTTATEEATANAEKASDAFAERDAAKVELTEALESLESADTLNTELESELAKLTATLEDDTERVTDEAAKQLARVGHEPVDAGEDEQASGGTVSLEAYNKLTGAEKAQYLADHAEELRKLAK